MGSGRRTPELLVSQRFRKAAVHENATPTQRAAQQEARGQSNPRESIVADVTVRRRREGSRSKTAE